MRRFIPFAIPSGSSPTVQTQEKSATITTNGGSVTVQPDSGFLLSSATVTANIPTQSKTATITTNGGSKTVNPDSGKLLTSVKVTANIPTEAKTQTITANGSYTITPTSGKLMTKATVSVNVPSGGGLPASIAAIEYGTFISSTVTNGETAHTITPSIRPDLVVIFSSENVTDNYAIVSAIIQTYNSPSGIVKTKAENGTLGGSANGILSYTNNNINLINISSARWKKYLTYHYFIIQLAEIPTASSDPPQTGTSEPGVML